MAEPILELGNPANWEQVYDETFTADPAPHGRYYPILDRIVPVLFDSPILAFAASSTDAQPNWRLGYWVRQYIAPSGVGTGAIESRQTKAYLNRTVMSRFQLYAAEYQVRLSFPYWLRSISVGIWEYVGPIDDTTEALIRERIDIVRIDLARLEAKVDTL